MGDASGTQGLSGSMANTSPFASQGPEASTDGTEGAKVAREIQAPRSASPASLPGRPASAQGFRSPSSWFNRTSSSTSSGHPKHSLLAMVPSQPLNRPIGSAPPSPAGPLQPPTIPALDQLKQPSGSASPAQVAPPLQQVSAPKDPATAPTKDQEVHAEQAEASKDLQPGQTSEANQAKQLKRDRRMRKTEASMRWQLMRRLAEISSDVELLNHEVLH